MIHIVSFSHKKMSHFQASRSSRLWRVEIDSLAHPAIRLSGRIECLASPTKLKMVGFKLRMKLLKIGKPGIWAFALIAVAVLFRLLLIAQGWPGTNSDEGTMGLEAMHIAFRGEHPIFFYGQNYMGTLEAYIGSVLFRLFGASLFQLRLGLVILFALFLVSIYLLASLLYTKKLALASLVLLCLGSSDVFSREVKAIGGYVETLFLGSLILLLASRLAFSYGTEIVLRRWRLAAYCSWGLVVGLGLWSNLLILPFVLAGSLILLTFCRYELKRTRAILSLLVGLIIGALPLIYYNITAPWAQKSWSAYWNIVHGGSAGKALTPFTMIKQLVGTFLIAIPQSTGANPICSLSHMPLFGPQNSQTVGCSITLGIYGLGYVVLLTIALVLAFRAYWRLRRLRQSSLQGWSSKERNAAVMYFGRLMLLSSAALIIVCYTVSPVSALQPWVTSRYLIGLLVATPAVISPLWNGSGIGNIKSVPLKYSKIMTNLKGVLLFLIGVLFMAGTISTFNLVPSVQAVNQQQYALIDNLERMDIKHLYSDYWTCNRLIFQSDERVICSVLDEQLQAGQDRYWPYHVIVESDPKASYVFPLGSQQATAFGRKVTLSPGQYQRFVFDGYVIYKPY